MASFEFLDGARRSFLPGRYRLGLPELQEHFFKGSEPLAMSVITSRCHFCRALIL
jgi:hypothetical protein